MRPLSVIHGLLGQAESARGSPADLDDHQRGWRTRIDRHEIQFVAADMDVPGQNGPTTCQEPDQDQ